MSEHQSIDRYRKAMQAFARYNQLGHEETGRPRRPPRNRWRRRREDSQTAGVVAAPLSTASLPFRPRSRPRRRLLLIAIVAAVGAAAIGFAISRPAPPPGAVTATTGAPPQPAPTASPSTAAVANGLPRIAAVRPRAARPGTRIVVVGVNLKGADRSTIARFGSERARTRCPSAERCVVTVPPRLGRARVRLRLATASGSSNAMTFRYR